MPAAESSSPGKPKRRRGRWRLLAAVAVVVLLVVIVPRLVDVENFRGQIEGALQSATGWEVELGEMDLTLLPGAALTVSPARLHAAGDSSHVVIEKIEIRAALLSLLKGKLDIRSIVAVAPKIRLVRLAADAGWIVPVAKPEAETTSPTSPGDEGVSGPGTPGSESDSTTRVVIGQIRIERGRLELEDHATDPALRLELRDVTMDYSPESLEVSGAANLGETGGRLAWTGSLGATVTIDFQALPTETLEPWVGTDLIHRGGLLSGQLQVHGPSRIAGRIDGEQVTLLAGEKPFREANVEFVLSSNGPDWNLERMEVTTGDVRITGRGTLLPELGLEMDLGPAPLEAVIAASESVLPLPLDLSPPGELVARLSVDQPRGGELTYDARGTMSASAMRLGEPLPDARDLRAEFELDRNGVLEVRILEGTVAGGPLRGTGRVDSVDPPGAFVFDGRIENAVLGGLLDGFVQQASGNVSGATGIRAQVSVDLNRPELDARALGGALELAAREVAMPDWDLGAALRDGIGRNLGRKSAAEETDGTAAIRELLESMQMRVDFDAWPWKLDDLSLAAQGIELKGAGTFDPIAGNVSLELASILGVERTRELIEEHSELKVLVDREGRLALPVTLEGPMLSPTVRVELDELLSRALDDRKDEAVDGLVKGLLDRFKKKKSKD